MARGPISIPLEKKIEIWRCWVAKDTNAAISIEVNLSEYLVKKIKREFRQYSYIEWLMLDDYPEIQYLHSKQTEYSQKRREEQSQKSWQSTDVAQKVIKISEFNNLISLCLYNPHTEVCTELQYWKPLHVEDFDYRLDPITWFYLCTPDFSEARYWKPCFLELKQYLQEIGFWNHYLELQGSVWKLQKQYEKVAKKLSEEDEVFQEIWEQIQDKRLRALRPSRIPADPSSDLKNYKPCYDSGYCDKVMKVLAENINGFSNWLYYLEEQLQKLNDDLLCS